MRYYTYCKCEGSDVRFLPTDDDLQSIRSQMFQPNGTVLPSLTLLDAACLHMFVSGHRSFQEGVSQNSVISQTTMENLAPCDSDHFRLNYLWLAGNEGMEKNMATTRMVYVGTTATIHSSIPS